METPKITVNEALIIAKEYHLEAEVTDKKLNNFPRH